MSANIYYLEKNTIEKLNEFNIYYALYLKNVNNATNDKSEYIKQLKYNVIYSYKLFDDSVIDLSNELSVLSNIFGQTTQSNYDASFNLILSSYSNILKTRNDLDFLYNELNNELNYENNILITNGNSFYETNITTILWSVVATTIVYIFFTKIK
jgi:hypothetical protein